jgi:hypothetical protein
MVCESYVIKAVKKKTNLPEPLALFEGDVTGQRARMTFVLT